VDFGRAACGAFRGRLLVVAAVKWASDKQFNIGPAFFRKQEKNRHHSREIFRRTRRPQGSFFQAGETLSSGRKRGSARPAFPGQIIQGGQVRRVTGTNLVNPCPMGAAGPLARVPPTQGPVYPRPQGVRKGSRPSTGCFHGNTM